jgi:DNA (cytosine-5)-methyltransferase 1
VAAYYQDIDPQKCATEPGIFSLAHRAANRVLKLRGYGDAIVAPLAAAFIKTFEESIK